MKNKSLITFITGNKNKLAEVKSILPFVQGRMLDLPELQEIDLRKVVKAKLQEAVVRHDGPVMVDDTALYLECFASKNGREGLPGPFIKWFLQTMTNEGLAQLVQVCGRTRARACSIIGYADGSGSTYFFEGSLSGCIVMPQGTSGFGWDHIFLPDGYTKTFACMGMKRKNQISPRSQAAQKLNFFLKCF